MKKTLFPLCALGLFAFCVLHPAQAASGAASGLSLWYSTVLPSLFPCMVLSGFLISSRLIRRLPPMPLVLTAGWLGGYPMGAKTAADLYKAGRITKKQGNRLLLLVCAPSPMFLTGFLGASLLRLSPGEILLCLAAVYAPPVLFYAVSSLRAGRRGPKEACKEEEGPSGDRSALEAFLAFEDAMMNGLLIIAKIGGYLMLFTMLACFFREWLPCRLFSLVLPGLLEMTSGAAFAAGSGLPTGLLAALCFSFAAFGGLSCFFQTMSVLRGTPLSGLFYLAAKAGQAALTFLLVLALL